MAIRRRLLALLVTVGTTLGLIPTASAGPLPAPPVTAAPATATAPDPAAHPHGRQSDPSGLTISVDDVRPAAIMPGRPVTITGVVSNEGGRGWADAQVYLELAAEPATTPDALAAFADSDPAQSTRIVEFGQFDTIGSVPAGTSKAFSLTVPFDSLPISGTPGVYDVAVSVIAGRGEHRDAEPEARARIPMPLLPAPPEQPRRSRLVTVLPLTAPVARTSQGVFLTDHLAQEVGFNGRLRNVLDFALSAPAGSLQVVLDPALHDALVAMSGGYQVQGHPEAEPAEGAGQGSAQEWLDDLNAVAVQQHLLLSPWGVPAASTLAEEELRGVVRAAVGSADEYDLLPVTTDLVGWEPGGSSRRGLATLDRNGTDLQLVSQSSLPRLSAQFPDQSAPGGVVVDSRRGDIRTAVMREDIGGVKISRDTPALEVRQYLLAESTVQSLAGRRDPVVLGLPRGWDPGSSAATVQLDTTPGLRVTAPESLQTALSGRLPRYDGRVRRPDDSPNLKARQLDAIRAMRRQMRPYLGIVTNADELDSAFTREFALSGSSAWAVTPVRGRHMTVWEARRLRDSLRRVTVSVPTFVALSSGSGRFPVTVSNGLDVAVDVRLSVVPQNPALQVDVIDDLRLEPGQQRDVQVRAHADGSGLTPVRVQLATPDDRRFGPRSELDVRATQIGLAIWLVMGIGLVVLVGAAIIRIIRRFRSPGAFSPREEPRHP